jgi:hypothetical protein
VHPAVSVECPDAKIGVFVNVPPVLREQRPVSGQHLADAAAVEKSTFPLGISAGHKAARVAGWMKYQAAASAKSVGIEPANPERKANNRSGSGCVHVGLHSRQSADREIPLRIAVAAIVRFAGEPAIEVITLPNGKTAGICGCPRDPLAATVLRKKPVPCPLTSDRLS